jgi:putative endonuclease
MDGKTWGVYIVECSDGTLYTGVTNNVRKRVSAHNAGKGAKYTRTRTPVTLRIWVGGMTKSRALQIEWQVKQQPRNRKVAYLKAVTGKFDILPDV